jgi:hypothetical protein
VGEQDRRYGTTGDGHDVLLIGDGALIEVGREARDPCGVAISFEGDGVVVQHPDAGRVERPPDGCLHTVVSHIAIAQDRDGPLATKRLKSTGQGLGVTPHRDEVSEQHHEVRARLDRPLYRRSCYPLVLIPQADLKV